jgi:hypothetical protein
MAPHFHKTAAPARQRVAAGKATETFSIEVSAGQVVESAPPTALCGSPLPQVLPDAPLRLHSTPVTTKRPRRMLPPWVVSLLAHVAMIGTLSSIGITTLSEQFDFTLELDAAPPLVDETTLQDVEVTPLDDLDTLAGQLPEELTVPTFAEALGEELAQSDQTQALALAEQGFGDAAALFGSGGRGLTEMVPDRDKLTATFFGTKVEGRRIVYVLDNSGGMRQGEFEMLVDELLRSVESLSDKQQFYVIFYSDTLYPLFYPRPVRRFVSADDRFKHRLREWLDSVEICMGNVVDEALAAAESIHPDNVFLLTDGDLDSTRDQRRMKYLLDAGGRDFPIHTVGLGTGEGSKAAGKLRQVAEANRGTFRAVAVTKEAKQAAKESTRPYHDKEPGRVWGLNVGGSWGK